MAADGTIAAHPREHGRMVGHASVLHTLAECSARMPNGILLYGDRGIGKATIAYRVARFLLGATVPEDGADTPFAFSMQDPVCARIRAEGCADLRVLEPIREKTAKTERISVRAVREAGGFLQLTSSDSGKKCVIIDAVDDMNANAQNALLKMLEEPAGRATLILIAHSAGAALPTVRSRCRPVYVPSLNENEALAVLQTMCPNASRETLADACRAAEHSPGRAAAFVQSGVLKQSSLLKEAFVCAANNQHSQAEQAIERLSLPAGDDAVWRHLLFIAVRFLCDAAAGNEPMPADTAQRYYTALCRLAKAADAVHLDRKTTLLNCLR